MSRLKITDDVAQNENGILARMWKNILKDLNLYSSLPKLVSDYTTKSKILASLSKVTIVKRRTKNNLEKNILASEMTWKTFHDLLFNYICAKRVIISIKIVMPNGSESVHGMTMLGEDYASAVDDDEVNTKDNKEKK